jgi:hypothetical protein
MWTRRESILAFKKILDDFTKKVLKFLFRFTETLRVCVDLIMNYADDDLSHHAATSHRQVLRKMEISTHAVIKKRFRFKAARHSTKENKKYYVAECEARNDAERA